MIKINLLPEEIGKRAAGGGRRGLRIPTGGVVPYAALLIVIYLGVLFAAYNLFSKSRHSANRVADILKKKTDIEKQRDAQRAAYEKQRQIVEEVESKYQVVQALSPKNRIFWSEKLNMLAKARMNLAVYMTRLALTEKIEEVETDDSRRRREDWRKMPKKPKGQETEPKIVKMPIINQTLTISAIAYGNDSPQRLRQITAFHDSLRRLNWKREGGPEVHFVDGLEPEFRMTDQRVDKVGGVEVLRFGLEIKALPQKNQSTGTQKRGASAAPPASAKGAKPSAGGK